MTDLNVICINGRLTRDCEIRVFDNGSSVVNFGIAVNRSVKKGEQWTDEASFFDVSYFTKSKIKDYLKKGAQVSIKGSLKQDRWEKDGVKQSKVSIFAENVQLIGEKQDSVVNQTSAYQTPVNSFPEDIPF